LSFSAIKTNKEKQRTKTEEKLHSPRGLEGEQLHWNKAKENKTPLDQPGEETKTSIARRARRKSTKEEGAQKKRRPLSLSEKTFFWCWVARQGQEPKTPLLTRVGRQKNFLFLGIERGYRP
jgi:hypothetical protein